jgi:hypothetical protein
MFCKIRIAKRGDNFRKAVAAKPDCVARVARTGDFHVETNRV